MATSSTQDVVTSTAAKPSLPTIRAFVSLILLLYLSHIWGFPVRQNFDSSISEEGARRDDFTIQFHHGGKMVNDGGMQIYIGGDETFKSHFDADRFGYFDLIDEIKQLGYAEWSRVAFTVPKSMKKIDIKDDNDVMLMLSYLDLGICVLDVYVVGGELGEAHVADSVGGEHADDGVNETHFEEVEGSVGGEHANDGVGETEVEYYGGDEDDSEDGDGLGKDEPEGEEDGPSLEKGGEGEDEQYEDWDEFDDGSYIPSTDRDNDTDYSSLDGFISEDDEHIEARDKFKKSNLRVITDDLFNGIVLN
ncbi:hypothetical protein SASPL_131070 [Salvia splendens]|uniref:PB1-like domain-containing protein n=1 Tax=Salvia splendens TaxID=180675 RepID=A0A8X8X769_SALSN|nr:hypothetical protein SASPL_131070 [Salvia splendens]